MAGRISFDQEWEAIHSTQVWGAYPPEHVIRFFARNYYNKNRNQTKILDFGCGAGACTWYLAREGFDVYAFDGSPSAVQRVEERLGKEKLKADLRVLDAVEIDYKEDFFDSVLDNACICSNRIDDIIVMYQEVYRTLKPGGRLISSCFGTNTLGYGTGNNLEEDTYRNISEGVLRGRGTIHFYTGGKSGTLFKILQEMGFKNIAIDTISYTDRGTAVEQFIGYGEK